MAESALAAAQRLFAQAVDGLRGVTETGSTGERVAALTLCEAAARQLDQVTSKPRAHSAFRNEARAAGLQMLMALFTASSWWTRHRRLHLMSPFAGAGVVIERAGL